jgi:ABC-type transport system substrate-binding protein
MSALLAACGGDDDDDDDDVATEVPTGGDATEPAGSDATEPAGDDATAEPTTAVADEEETEEADVGEGQYGGTLTIAYVQTVTDIDITSRNVGSLNEVAHYIYETLFDRDPEGEVVNLLVENASISDDGLVHTWTLQPNVTFHDGNEFNAESVKWNLDRKVELQLSLYDLIPFESVEVVDDLTVEVTLTRPSPAMYGVLATKTWSMVNPTLVEEGGDEVLQNEASGTGPFVLVENIPNEVLRLEKNQNYWQEGLPYFDEVVFQVVPDISTRATMLEAGETQMSLGLSTQDLERFKDTSGIKVLEGLGSQQYYITLNNSRPPLDDVRVRQAINHAVDKQGIIDAVFLGSWAEPATAPYMNETAQGFVEGGTFEYDPDLARQLLEEAGWTAEGDGIRQKDGEELALTVHTRSGSTPGDIEIAELVQSMLQEVGIALEIIVLDSAAFLDAVTKPVEEADYNLVNLTWGTFTGDAEYVMLTALKCDSAPPRYFNRAHFCNPEVDALIEESLEEPTLEERNAVYAEIIPMVTELAPILMLVNARGGVAIAENLEGVYLEAASINWPAKYAWFSS